jgi:hypothetical protein
MVPPIAIPFKHRSACNHLARKVISRRKHAPGSRARAASWPVGPAAHCGCGNCDMTCGIGAASAAQERNERVARFNCRGIGAGLVGTASTVHLACGNARQAHMRAFGAPYRAVTIPDVRRRTLEILSGSDDCGCVNQEHLFTFIAFCGRTIAPGRRY